MPVIGGLKLLMWQGVEQSKLFINIGLTQPDLVADWEAILADTEKEVETNFMNLQPGESLRFWKEVENLRRLGE